jgi:hypothetical protein
MPVPRSPNESDANTLPDPELNPLLNPLLAAHMGRWAEVYFTNPPEKRGEAIAELLRELRNISPGESTSIQVVHDEHPTERENEKENTATAEAPDPRAATTSFISTCQVCAYKNSAGQRFCGMCGVPLQVTTETDAPQVAQAEPVAAGSWCERSLGVSAVADAIDPAVTLIAADRSQDDLEPAWAPPEKYFPDLSVESGSAPNRYRVYVGVAVAILLIVIVYVAWRGTQALPGSAVPQTAPAKTIPPAEPATTTAVPQPGVTGNALPKSAPPASPVQSQIQPDTSSRKDEAADAQPEPRIVPVNTISPVPASGQSGAEELALAEKYLNGNQGVTRDNAEAALWLWKAVGKGNLAATMTLSDLYLQGDGVPKSCDQARVLLDAAARKGAKAAAERLRNLQAFGCE